ncbi:thiamine ABC transporter substrate-binding protein [uncultured Desulfobacter sp.]|uniref:thiamine ABC transporter substrate-binding protein n=1 Tax=uncultured Desulfobacter sp. TaxID=240139 RepID=UPI002AAB63E7|nr:thiamine ABC transporter substrate-binding protein [uncultured Desulfobacter sp.]
MKIHAAVVTVIVCLFLTLPMLTGRALGRELTIMTHDSFSMSESVLEEFKKAVGADITILRSGDAGQALNKAILSKNNPMADLFFGVDNTFIGRALDNDMFIAYTPKGFENIDTSLLLDKQNRLIPVDFGDVCLNYDIKWFKAKKLAPPAGLEDLIRPEYKDLTVVQNPATSSPGLAFLLATISRFGQNSYISFWRQLKANGVMVVNGWQDAYWGQFTAASKGDRPIVVSYASSPAAEVFYAEQKPEKAPTGVVIGNGSAFRQIEFAGILKNSANTDLAQKAMDFLLSQQFQEDIPLQMFVFPANTKAKLPEVFLKHAKITDAPASLPADAINRNRDKWIREWTEKLLQ